MKTTIEIADDLLIEAKQYAADHGETLRQLLELSLRLKLDSSKAERPKFRMKDGSVGGEGLAEGMDWPTMMKLGYEGRGE